LRNWIGYRRAFQATARQSFIATFDLDKTIKNALYGTTIKWNDLVSRELVDPKIEPLVGKKTKESLGDHSAKRVLDKIDELNKAVKGTRAAYEILCDYASQMQGPLTALCSIGCTNTILSLSVSLP
jgi:hypothetical protein